MIVKYFFFIVGIVVAIFMTITYMSPNTKKNTARTTPGTAATSDGPETPDQREAPATLALAEELDTPWAIAFLPDNSMLVTERAGNVLYIDPNGALDPNPIAVLDQVTEIGEGGLLGITAHPDFAQNHYVYLYYTYSGSGDSTLNRVVRMVYNNKKLSNEATILEHIPGSANHDGGRIKFGPDGYLYITTGDAENPSQAQDTTSLGGKILRITDQGKAAPGNPFGNLVYSYGHRNSQGLAWDETGQLWETEHGPSGTETGNDEVNRIDIGKNYGWPTIRGTQTKGGMEKPVIESGTGTAWAPAGAAFLDGKLYFGGLRGEALYAYNPSTSDLQELFKGTYGRIRDVVAGPDGMLYITTSNKDGRGSPLNGDDKVIRVNPAKL